MIDPTTTPGIRFLPLTTAAAWQSYLEATQDVSADRYLQVEQAAWEQLQAALATLPSNPVGAA